MNYSKPKARAQAKTVFPPGMYEDAKRGMCLQRTNSIASISTAQIRRKRLSGARFLHIQNKLGMCARDWCERYVARFATSCTSQQRTAHSCEYLQLRYASSFDTFSFHTFGGTPTLFSSSARHSHTTHFRRTPPQMQHSETTSKKVPQNPYPKHFYNTNYESYKIYYPD